MDRLHDPHISATTVARHHHHQQHQLHPFDDYQRDLARGRASSITPDIQAHLARFTIRDRHSYSAYSHDQPRKHYDDYGVHRGFSSYLPDQHEQELEHEHEHAERRAGLYDKLAHLRTLTTQQEASSSAFPQPHPPTRQPSSLDFLHHRNSEARSNMDVRIEDTRNSSSNHSSSVNNTTNTNSMQPHQSQEHLPPPPTSRSPLQHQHGQPHPPLSPAKTRLDLVHSQGYGPLDGGLPPLTSSPNTDRYSSSGTADDSTFTKGSSFSSDVGRTTVGGDGYFDTIDAKQQSRVRYDFSATHDSLDARARQWPPARYGGAEEDQQQRAARNGWPHYLPEELSSMSEAEWKARFDPQRQALAESSLRASRGSPALPFGRRSSPPIEYAVFVCDLAPDVREEDLVAAFLNPPGPRPFISTRSAKVMLDTVTGRSMGFGFVRFTDEQDSQRALVEMQGVTITSRSGQGRPVRLNPANPRRGGEGSTPSDASPGEHPAASNMALRDYFDNRGRYSNPTPAEIAMQSSLSPSTSSWASLPGFPTIPATGASGPVDVSLRNNSAPSGSSFGGPASLTNTGFTLGPSTLPSPSSALDPNNTTVFVGGLSSLISEDTLKTFFAPFGAIAYVKIPPGKGCGFVSFLRKIDAERAIERMQGFPVGGCRIRLSWGRSQGEKSQHQAQVQMNNLSQLAGLAGLGGQGGLKGLRPQQLAHLADLSQALAQQQSGGGRGRVRAHSGNGAGGYGQDDGNAELTQEILQRFLQTSVGSSDTGGAAGSGGSDWPTSFSDPYASGYGHSHAQGYGYGHDQLGESTAYSFGSYTSEGRQRMAASARPFESRRFPGANPTESWGGEDVDLANVFGSLGIEDDPGFRAPPAQQRHVRGVSSGGLTEQPYRSVPHSAMRPHALTLSEEHRPWQHRTPPSSSGTVTLSSSTTTMPPSWSAPDVSSSPARAAAPAWSVDDARRRAAPSYKSYRDEDEDDRHKGFSPFSPVVGGGRELRDVTEAGGESTKCDQASSSTSPGKSTSPA